MSEPKMASDLADKMDAAWSTRGEAAAAYARLVAIPADAVEQIAALETRLQAEKAKGKVPPPRPGSSYGELFDTTYGVGLSNEPAEQIATFKVKFARLRHDHKQLSRAYMTLRSKLPHDGKKPCEREAVTSYACADWPYPREWELEDGELRRERDEARAEIGKLQQGRVLLRKSATDNGTLPPGATGTEQVFCPHCGKICLAHEMYVSCQTCKEPMEQAAERVAELETRREETIAMCEQLGAEKAELEAKLTTAQEALFDRVMLAKKSGYEDGKRESAAQIADLTAKLDALEKRLDKD